MGQLTAQRAKMLLPTEALAAHLQSSSKKESRTLPVQGAERSGQHEHVMMVGRRRRKRANQRICPSRGTNQPRLQILRDGEAHEALSDQERRTLALVVIAAQSTHQVQ